MGIKIHGNHLAAGLSGFIHTDGLNADHRRTRTRWGSVCPFDELHPRVCDENHPQTRRLSLAVPIDVNYLES